MKLALSNSRNKLSPRIRVQYRYLQNDSKVIKLLYPATLDNGILKLRSQQERESIVAFDQAAQQGRFLKFVPASGAATRMFQDILDFIQSRIHNEKIDQFRMRRMRQLIKWMPKLAFYDLLKREMDYYPIEVNRGVENHNDISQFTFLMFTPGLNYAKKSKGLILFHKYGEESHTAFEEQVLEGLKYIQDGQKKSKFHFTIAPDEYDEYQAMSKLIKQKWFLKNQCRIDISFSVQDVASNTIAIDLQKNIIKDQKGHIVMRPGGHGSLLSNLNKLKADIVFIRNIDNIASESAWKKTVYWKKVLGGYLVGIQKQVHVLLKELHKRPAKSSVIHVCERFILKELKGSFITSYHLKTNSEKISILKQFLNRPIRVCGMVKNKKEPGGGPFWIYDEKYGKSLQIVESAEVDFSQKKQRAIFQSATHFNPVDIVCGLKKWDGNSFDLRQYMNPKAVIITQKNVNGIPAKVLEHPGLWNGSMADWITVFIEVPLETFTPVKTIFDLMRKSHLQSHF
jgi:hypothetical protein